jgi:hypothetical protein
MWLSAVPTAVLATPVMTLGPGANSCGTWVSERRQDSLVSLQIQTWVLGFLTAYNEFVATDGQISRGVDVQGLMGWIDNYCQAHPLEDVESASVHLVLELKRRKP